MPDSVETEPSLEQQIAMLKEQLAQAQKLTALGGNQSSLPWEARHHGLFVGFAPLDKPRYATAVVVEHGGSGSGSAAPVAKEVLLTLQQIERET